jgi:hypothetical protein
VVALLSPFFKGSNKYYEVVMEVATKSGPVTHSLIVSTCVSELIVGWQEPAI